jgi:hypothetical protein
LYKDKIISFPLFNTCYPQNLARNLARFLTSGTLILIGPDCRGADSIIKPIFNLPLIRQRYSLQWKDSRKYGGDLLVFMHKESDNHSIAN